MDSHLTKLEAEIADVEREIAALPKTNAKMGKRHKAVCETRAALHAKHELLVRQVQWATVGAAKPGEVL
jgi:septal ring factor EnvC (AmiA/AmiB activator)